MILMCYNVDARFVLASQASMITHAFEQMRNDALKRFAFHFLGQSLQNKIFGCLLDIFGYRCNRFVVGNMSNWSLGPLDGRAIFFNILLDQKEAHCCPYFVESSLSEMCARYFPQPYNRTLMRVCGLYGIVVPIVTFYAREMNLPVPFGWVYNEVTAFHFVNKAVKLSAIDGNGSGLVGIGSRDRVLKSLTIRREL